MFSFFSYPSRASPRLASIGTSELPWPSHSATSLCARGEMQLMRTAESWGQRLVGRVSGALRLASGILWIGIWGALKRKVGWEGKNSKEDRKRKIKKPLSFSFWLRAKRRYQMPISLLHVAIFRFTKIPYHSSKILIKISLYFYSIFYISFIYYLI